MIDLGRLVYSLFLTTGIFVSTTIIIGNAINKVTILARLNYLTMICVCIYFFYYFLGTSEKYKKFNNPILKKKNEERKKI